MSFKCCGVRSRLAFGVSRWVPAWWRHRRIARKHAAVREATADMPMVPHPAPSPSSSYPLLDGI